MCAACSIIRRTALQIEAVKTMGLSVPASWSEEDKGSKWGNKNAYSTTTIDFTVYLRPVGTMRFPVFFIAVEAVQP